MITSQASTVTIEVEDSALEEARQIFANNKEFVAMLRRMHTKFIQHDRVYICRIACTNGQWKRYKDVLTNTRAVFIEEKSPGHITLVVKHVLPRTDLTYEIFKWLFECGA